MKGRVKKPSDTAGRRKLLKGMVAGGGVVAGSKAVPEKWTKPLVETTVLPAHAQTTTEEPGGGGSPPPSPPPPTPLNLACQVDGFTAQEVGGGSAGGSFNPAAGPVSGGATVTFDSFNSFDNLITLSGLSATLSPLPIPAGEMVSLAVMSSGDMSSVSPSPPPAAPNGAGVASFPNVSGTFVSDSSTGSTGSITLVFSSPSATSDCTISFTFIEDQEDQ